MTFFGASRSPRNIVFGPGQRRSVAGYASGLGQSALIVTDSRMAADPETGRLAASLTAAGVKVAVFSDTIAELPLDSLQAGCEAGRRHGADLVIGLGGGSCIDAAKIIALILTHGGHPRSYYGELNVPGPIMPVIALPTTAGTGSEVTPVAVIADPEKEMKVGIASPHLIPHTAICDPELTYSCPAGLTAISGADALTHAIEAFTARRRSPTETLVHEHVFLGKNAISDAYALLAIGHLTAGLKRAYDNPSDTEARQRVMLGSLAAGLAFGTAGTATAHAIQYPVGTLTHTPHGLGVATLMPYVMDFNRLYCESELALIAVAMGISSTGRTQAQMACNAINGVDTLFASIGIPVTIADLGVRAVDLPMIVERAMGSTRLIKNSPRELTLPLMADIVGAAFHGRKSPDLTN